MDRAEFIQHAFDSDAFLTSTTTAGYVNPEIWDKDLFGYLKANLVMEGLGEVYDRTNVAGDVFHITVGVTPSAAAAVAETAAVAYQAYQKTQVNFTPSEAATGLQVSNKELDRTFLPVMNEMVEEMGYALALVIDNDIITTVTAGAGNAVVANGVLESAIASSDTLDYDSIINGRVELVEDKVKPYALVVNPFQHGSLLKSQQFSYYQNFGEKVAKNGFIGTIAGVEVYETTQIPTTDNVAKALLLGKDSMGKKPFGTLYKRKPYILKNVDIDYRQNKFVGVVDYDVQVLRNVGICTIATYAA